MVSLDEPLDDLQIIDLSGGARQIVRRTGGLIGSSRQLAAGGAPVVVYEDGAGGTERQKRRKPAVLHRAREHHRVGSVLHVLEAELVEVGGGLGDGLAR